MQAPLAALANQGVIVNYLDLNLIGDRVAANLRAFGLQSAGACPIACVTTDPELLSRYLFYVDQVHLTSAGFAIVGRYAVRQLEAPLHLEGQAEVGLQAATSFGSTLLGRLDLSAARAGGASGRRPQLLRQRQHGERGPGRHAAQPRLSSWTRPAAPLGVEYDLGGGAVIGAALNYSRGEADMVTGSGPGRKPRLAGRHLWRLVGRRRLRRGLCRLWLARSTTSPAPP